MRLSALALVGCLAAFATATASAADYDSDPSFAPSAGLGGWTRQYFGVNDEYTIGFARASAAADAGFILAADTPGGTNVRRIALFKLDREGNRVASGFGTDGRTLVDLGVYTVDAMTVGPGGRIIVAGSRPDSGGCSDFAVARFNADGSLDTGFGSNGVAGHTFEVSSTCLYEQSSSVVTDADGKIVVTGDVGTADGLSHVGLFRLNVNGSLDTTFGSNSNGMGGSNGSLVRFDGTRNASASKLLKVANGQYVVVGTSRFSSTDTDFAARLFRPNGEEWAGNAGAITLPIDEPIPGGTLYDYANDAVAVDPLTILVVGTASNHAAARRFKLDNPVAGLYTNLINDTGFVGSGIAGRPYRYVSSSDNRYAHGVAVRGNGDALIVGRVLSTDRDYGLLTRLRSNGQPDPGFAGVLDGVAVSTPTLGGGNSWYTTLTHVLIDGTHPVIAGYSADSTTSDDDFDAVVTRLQSDMIFANGFQ